MYQLQVEITSDTQATWVPIDTTLPDNALVTGIQIVEGQQALWAIADPSAIDLEIRRHLQRIISEHDLMRRLLVNFASTRVRNMTTIRRESQHVLDRLGGTP